MFKLKNIPNILSLFRICIALQFPILPVHWRITVLTLAMISEYLDGTIARKFGWVTPLGTFLDPVADRVLALMVGLTLIFSKQLTWPDFSLLFFRDVAVSLGVFYVIFIQHRFKEFENFKPNFVGKLATFFQYLVFFNILYLGFPNIWILFFAQSISLIAATWYFARFHQMHAHHQ